MTQKETLESLIKEQLVLIHQLQEVNALQAESIKKLTEQNQQLRSQVAWLKRQFFGRKSEKLAPLDPNQLSLFDDQFKKEENDLEEASEKAEEKIDKIERKTKKKQQNRKSYKDLPVIEVILEPEKVDLNLYKRIGEERTRTLEFKPGELYIKEIIRPKYGLKDASILPDKQRRGVLIAPLPLLPIYKGLPGASMLSEILIQKYVYHVPFYRQIQVFKNLGATIPENTLNGWFKPVCEILRPLYKELKKQVLATDYVQVDETVLPVINKESHKANKEYLWVVRSVMNNLLFFHYDRGSRSGPTARNLLKTFSGYLQSDGYKVYNSFEDKDKVCLVGCLAHIRRHFESALDENKSLAEYALRKIQCLYKIEKKAKVEELSFVKIAELRERLATPILNSLEKWMEKTYPTVLPKSLMGKAIAYAYSLWPRMKPYLKDGRIAIDNNGAENSIRPIAIGRKNFLFCGNHEAARNTAIICSLLSSCKASDINPMEWLKDSLEKLPYYLKPESKLDLSELLPNHWVNTKSSKSLS